MYTNEPLLEPLKGYNSIYKKQFEENTIRYFNALVKKANVNVEENKSTVSKYKKKLSEIDALLKKINKQKGLKTFLIILIIILSIIGAYLLVSSIQESIDSVIGICSFSGVLILDIVFILLIVKKINPKIKSFNENKCKLEQEAQALLSLAWKQMSSLNVLYDWGIPGEIINKTIPLIEWDKYFNVEKYHYLHDKYGLKPNTEKNVSTVFCSSGSILGNPFLICKDYVQRWYQKRYDGYLTIHWKERVKTNDGYKTVSRSQTLHASVTRPAPSYNYETYLVYGNEAAPDLKFYRNPSGVSGKTENEIDKIVKKGSKKLDKKAEKALLKNSTYTKLGNDEFEVLFDGTNRNNEVQYRLLFTPLAQKNLLDIIKKPKPFGDDFYFEKDRQLNYIQSKHSQSFDYSANPSLFVHYDYEFARKIFIEYNKKYFESFYFDLAPLMSVPLYQQHKSHEYIYNKGFNTNVSIYEHEAIANSFNINYLKPKNADTPSILKTKFICKEGVADRVNIDAYSFNAQRRVTYVSVLGGDGRSHSVPVYWLEYIPVKKTSQMVIEEKNSSRFDFNCILKNKDFNTYMKKFTKMSNCLYERNLFAFLLLNDISQSDIQTINKFYQGNVESIKSDITAEDIVRSVEQELRNMHSINEENKVNADKLKQKLEDDNVETKEVEVSDEDKLTDEEKEKLNSVDEEESIDDDSED